MATLWRLGMWTLKKRRATSSTPMPFLLHILARRSSASPRFASLLTHLRTRPHIMLPHRALQHRPATLNLRLLMLSQPSLELAHLGRAHNILEQHLAEHHTEMRGNGTVHAVVTVELRE